MALGKKAPSKRMSKLITWVCALVSVGVTLYFCWSYGLEPYLIRQDERRAVTEATDHWSAPIQTATPPIAEAAGSVAEPSAREEQAGERPLDEAKASSSNESEERPLGEAVADYHQDYDVQELAGDVPMALVRVPRWGDDYQAAVLNSVENEALHQAVGHYAFSAMPGACGNCVMAAHRSPPRRPIPSHHGAATRRRGHRRDPRLGVHLRALLRSRVGAGDQGGRDCRDPTPRRFHIV